jgi:PAS domain S-box-containing protein
MAIGALALLAVTTTWSEQTRTADLIFVCAGGVLTVHGLLVLLYLKRVPSPHAGLKYFSITLDLSCLFTAHLASFFNYSGVYEIFRAPGTWLLICLFNGLGALRYSARSSLFAAGLTVGFGASLVFLTLHAPNVPLLAHSAFIGEGLNLDDCVISVLFSALPALCAAIVASNSKRLVLRTMGHARARARAEDRQRQILDSMADMILVKGADAKILWANRALREAWGSEQAELVGELYGGHASEDERQRSLAQHALVVQSQDTVLMPDERFARADGRVLQVDTVTSPIFDASGQVAMTVSVSRDVSDRKKLQAHLRLSETMSSVGTLAAGMAHEINNPLTYVLANLEFLSGRLPKLSAGLGPLDSNDLITALEEAHEGASRVQRIVKDLKDAAHGDPEQLDEIDVKQALESALKLTGNELSHRAKIARDYEQVPNVNGNPSRLGQVLLNLLVNAAQAIREGAADDNEVRLNLRAASGDRVAIEVVDTGHGIAEEHLPHLFDPFFTTKDVGEGTGLGLFICHRIISDMGGTIEAESRPGHGATFRVLLPAATRPSQRIEVAPALLAPTRRGRILVVDDDTLVAKALSRLLAVHHDVIALTRADEALTRLERGERFDLIFCDLMMPVTTGQEFHERLRELAPEQAERTIFITGGAFTDTSRKFLETTANDRLEKPFDRGKLDAIVARYLN